MDHAARSGFRERRGPSIFASLDGRRTGRHHLSVRRRRSRAQLDGVRGGHRTLCRSRAEFRVRGRRRQHRISRDGPSSGAQKVRGRCARPTARPAIANGTAIVPFDQLPQAFNPPSGIIATANQNPFPVAQDGAKKAGAEFLVNGNFAPPYRVRQIRALLESRPKWQPEEMLRVQTDVYSAFHQFLAKQIVAAWDRKKGTQRPPTPRPIDELRALGWPDEEGCGRSADRHAGVRRIAQGGRRAGGAEIGGTRIRTRLDHGDRTPADGASARIGFRITTRCCCARSTRAFRRECSGRDRKSRAGSTGQYQTVERSTNPVDGRLPLIGKYFNIGPVPFGGSPVSVAAIHRTHRAVAADRQRSGGSESFLRESRDGRIRPEALGSLLRTSGTLIMRAAACRCSSAKWTRRKC